MFVCMHVGLRMTLHVCPCMTMQTDANLDDVEALKDICFTLYKYCLGIKSGMKADKMTKNTLLFNIY